MYQRGLLAGLGFLLLGRGLLGLGLGLNKLLAFLYFGGGLLLALSWWHSAAVNDAAALQELLKRAHSRVKSPAADEALSSESKSLGQQRCQSPAACISHDKHSCGLLRDAYM